MSSVKKAVLVCWVCYGLWIVYFSLKPFQFVNLPPLTQVLKEFFLDIFTRRYIPKQFLLYHFILYAPMGFLTSILLFRPGRSMSSMFVPSILFNALLGFLLEIVQAFTATRVSTIIDFIAQTLGAGAGGFLAIVWMQAGHDPPGQVTGEARYKKALRTLTLLYGLAIVPAGLDHGIYFLVFATFATLCHFSLRFYAIPAVTRELITLCSAMAIATAIEIGHYVAERHVYLMNMLIASLGGIAGSILAAGIEKSFLPAMGPPAQSNDEAAPARVWRLLEIPILFGYSLLVAALLLFPFDFDFSRQRLQSHWSRDMLLPFYTYGTRSDLGSATRDFLFTLFIYLPLGGLLYHGLRPLKSAVFIALALCLVYSTGIELLHFFAPRRYPEITDVLSAMIGATLGLLSVRSFVRYTPHGHKGTFSRRCHQPHMGPGV